MKVNEITNAIIGAAIEVHKFLGPGLLESAYEECLCHELTLKGIPFSRQQALPVSYKVNRWLKCKLLLTMKFAEAGSEIAE